MNKLRTKNGQLTAYAFGCGYVETERGLTLSKDDHGNFYWVKGWDRNSNHVYTTHESLRTARAFIRKIT